VENPTRTVRIVPDPAATDAQKAAFRAWTGQPFPASPPPAVRPRPAGERPVPEGDHGPSARGPK
jgi:hypothetical protein